jgi:hypothetical protein
MGKTFMFGKTFSELIFNKWVFAGSTIALGLILLFLFTAQDPDPSWPRYWMIRPLVIVPLAGAAGGAFFEAMGVLRGKGGWYTIVGIVLGLLVYLVGLWMGFVLGLDGTWWN